MLTRLNYQTLCVLYFIAQFVTSMQILDTTATMELIIHTDDQVKLTKYVRGIYSPAGKITNVEGNIEQVHPNTICSDRPLLTFGNIYILKLEPPSVFQSYRGFCESAAEKAGIAIRYGATAVVLIITDYDQAITELSHVIEPLERPVVIVRDQIEEDKLFVILSYKESAYMRISPVKTTLTQGNSLQPNDVLNNKENITYIGIAVIFGLIIVLSLIALGVIIKLRKMRRQIQFQARGELLESIGTRKYIRKLRSALSSSSTSDSQELCAICLENYKSGEDLRILPCSHQYHKKCIDKWLLEHRTCPCCCGDIDDLLRESFKTLASSQTNEPETSTTGEPQNSTHNPPDLMLIHSQCLPHQHRTPDRHRHQNQHSARTRCHRHNKHQHSTRAIAQTTNNPHHDFLYQHYQYLLYRLYELKRQRPPSTAASDSEVPPHLSNISSCYSSILNMADSLPSENDFLGDCCQGGLPQQYSTCSLSDCDTTSQVLKQCASSKSTLPSIESSNISPYVSEWDFDPELGHISRSISEHRIFIEKYQPSCLKEKSRSMSRTVRFRDPESEFMSSADDSGEAESSEETKLMNKECELSMDHNYSEETS